MVSKAPNWDLYRTFMEVARDGSLSGAARRLAIAQPTVGRHIEALEKALGIDLFTRSPRGLLPTPAALELLSHAETMFTASTAILRAASAATASEKGVVRVTASEIIGFEVLPAILAGFRRLHPEIVLEVVLSNRFDDLLQRRADIAIRMGRPSQNALITRRIGQVSIGLYAHRQYVEVFGLPQTREELLEHCLIGYDHDDHSFRSVAPETTLSREAFGFRCDSDAAQLAAVRAGIGIGPCQAQLARRDPDLVPVLPGEVAFPLEVWVAMHENLKSTLRVQLLFRYLDEALVKYVSS